MASKKPKNLSTPSPWEVKPQPGMVIFSADIRGPAEPHGGSVLIAHTAWGTVRVNGKRTPG